MKDESENSMEIITRNAQESGNPHAFYSGMVFGLGHAYGFLAQNNRDTAVAMIEVLLERLDDMHFKKNET